MAQSALFRVGRTVCSFSLSMLLLPACGVKPAGNATPSATLKSDSIPDAGLQALPLAAGAPCDVDAGAGVCGSGLLCCKPCCDNSPAVCTAPAQNDAGIGVGQCPLADLAINADRLQSELGLGSGDFSADDCAVQEGCVDAPGKRQLLRFSVVTPNVGTADLVMGDPANNPGLFQWSACHGHYHFNGYALYRLLDAQGNQVTAGRKRAFCLEDFERQDKPPLGGRSFARYDCGDQGISVGWQDTYYNGLSCQFIDVTGVPAGHYTLEVTINPEKLLSELSYDNNKATAEVDIPAQHEVTPTDRCTGVVNGIDRECDWKNGGTFTCAPGARVRTGCAAACGVGTCTGDTVMRVCPDGAVCSQSQALGQNDDGCNSSCSSVAFTCPASGKYTVLWAPFNNLETASCTVAHTP